MYIRLLFSWHSKGPWSFTSRVRNVQFLILEKFMSLLMKVLATVQCAPSILILLPMLPLQNLQTMFSKRFFIFDEVRVELLYTLMEISWTFQVSSAFPSFMSVNFYFGIFTRRAKYLHFEKVSKSKSCDPRILLFTQWCRLWKNISTYTYIWGGLWRSSIISGCKKFLTFFPFSSSSSLFFDDEYFLPIKYNFQSPQSNHSWKRKM